MSVDFWISGEQSACGADCRIVGRCNACYALRINMANTNAMEILRILDLPAQCYGEVRGSDLLTRIATAVYEDGARVLTTEGRYTDLGRREGYVSERLGQLKAMALRAGHLGLIIWG